MVKLRILCQNQFKIGKKGLFQAPITPMLVLFKITHSISLKTLVLFTQISKLHRGSSNIKNLIKELICFTNLENQTPVEHILTNSNKAITC